MNRDEEGLLAGRGAGRTATHRTTDSLRKAILRGELRGTLDETDLGRAFGVSHIPIREALRTLAAEGFLQITPYRGAEVLPLSAREHGELCDLRLAIYAVGMFHLATLLKEEHFVEARRLAEQVKATAGSPTDEAFAARKNFHNYLYRATGLDAISRLADSALSHHARYFRATMPLMATDPAFFQQQLDALSDLQAGDARAAIRRLKAVYDTLVVVFREICHGALGADAQEDGPPPAGPMQLTRSGEVARRLRDDIISERLKSGVLLSEDDLAARYGTSRIPLREALRELHVHGFVDMIPHKGTRVLPLRPACCTHLIEARALLECIMLRDALPRLTDADLASATLHAERKMASRDVPEDFARANTSYMDALLAPARRPHHHRMVQTIASLYYRTAAILAKLRGNGLLPQHEQRMIALCAARDWPGLVAYIATSYRQAADAVSAELARQNGEPVVSHWVLDLPGCLEALGHPIAAPAPRSE